MLILQNHYSVAEVINEILALLSPCFRPVRTLKFRRQIEEVSVGRKGREFRAFQTLFSTME